MKTHIFLLLLSILSYSLADSYMCGSRSKWGEDGQASNMVINYEEPYHRSNPGLVAYGYGVGPEVDREKPEDDRESKNTTGLNLSSGVFTVPKDGNYFVTVSALIQPNKLDMTSYAQLFLLKNDKLVSMEDYIIVEVNGRTSKVADLRREMQLLRGETIKLFVGHHTSTKIRYSSSGNQEYYGGFNLQDIRFCIFS